ncbi:nucleoside-diphosphate kinase [Abyssicoccus albus]|uniref:Nucleoside diphosphate kinase n=2 Tax=Abyssicoccus albus TaxID=1817405 RepID=A0A3N5C6Q3_9BACL|nr:nucleoside-diphosphate kinase [Abyssicoccus albus]RPF58028.1 nucleoside diphosphate kinase [Abyssicoccus albus]
MEKTFVMIKPDGVQRRLIGEITSRFEKKGLNIVKAELLQATEDIAKEHYGEHSDKPFFGELVEFITSGPVFAMILSGENAVSVARTLIGETNPASSQPGTIRGDYGLTVGKNIIHGSDAVESAEREISIWF